MITPIRMTTPPGFGSTHRSATAISLHGGIFLRLKRSSEHIEELERQIASLHEVDPNVVPDQDDPERIEIERPLTWAYGHTVSILIGEVVYNLRSALDYLVFTLAWIDSGEFQEDTQFPIDDSPDIFEERIRGKRKGLRGLNSAHIALIKQLQPCYGCRWTKTLRILSNHDKHRQLIKITQMAKFSARVISVGDPYAGLLVTEYFDMQMKSKHAGAVTMRDGTPIIDTLKILETQVSHLRVEFDSFILSTM